MTYDEYQRKYKQYLDDYKAAGEKIVKHIERIRKNWHTKIIKYPQHKASFDYVYDLFPSFEPKEVVVYSCDRDLLDKLGYNGVGGFFERVLKTIVIPRTLVFKEEEDDFSVCAKITEDEVLVHELLHYVSNNYKNKVISVEIEEEFAYGNSVGYLLAKGYSNDEIVKNNLLPFYYHISQSKTIREVLLSHNYDLKKLAQENKYVQEKVIKKHKKEIHERTLEVSTDRAHQVIEIYTRKKVGAAEIDMNAGGKDFGFLDI